MVGSGKIRCLRWIDKFYPKSAGTIRDALNELSSNLLDLGFILKDDTFDGVATQINSANFERLLFGNVDYVLVIFDKDNPLKFQVTFGSKEGADPFEWIRAGSLVKRQSDAISAKWWGAGWFSLSKEQDFTRDWAKFLASIGHIQTFLAGEGERGFVRARTIGG